MSTWESRDNPCQEQLVDCPKGVSTEPATSMKKVAEVLARSVGDLLMEHWCLNAWRKWSPGWCSQVIASPTSTLLNIPTQIDTWTLNIEHSNTNRHVLLWKMYSKKPRSALYTLKKCIVVFSMVPSTCPGMYNSAFLRRAKGINRLCQRCRKCSLAGIAMHCLVTLVDKQWGRWGKELLSSPFDTLILMLCWCWWTVLVLG